MEKLRPLVNIATVTGVSAWMVVMETPLNNPRAEISTLLALHSKCLNIGDFSVTKYAVLLFADYNNPDTLIGKLISLIYFRIWNLPTLTSLKEKISQVK